MKFNPMAWFRTSQNSHRADGAHMTFAKTSVGRSITRTGVFLRKQLWIWPIIAVVLLTIIGLAVRHEIESTMAQGLQSQLQTLLDVETSMLETWLHAQRSNADSLANGVDLRRLVYQLLDSSTPTAAQGKDAKSVEQIQAQLDKVLAPALSAHDYTRFFIADKSKRMIAATSRELIGKQDIAEFDAAISGALAGKTTVATPFASVVALKDDSGRLRTGVPTMIVVAPIRDESFQVVAALSLRIRPELEFTRILQLGRMGNSGETYAFDKNGLFVSNSRFDDSLILLGLLPDQENSHSILQLMVRDPGGDMTQGFRPGTRRRELPMTRMAQDAVAGNSGVDVEGYRDF